MANSEDVLEAARNHTRTFTQFDRACQEYHLAEARLIVTLAAEVRELRQKPDGELRRDLSDAQQMIVLLMNQREWGSATGALLEDPVVKRAYAAMGGGEGEA